MLIKKSSPTCVLRLGATRVSFHLTNGLKMCHHHDTERATSLVGVSCLWVMSRNHMHIHSAESDAASMSFDALLAPLQKGLIATMRTAHMVCVCLTSRPNYIIFLNKHCALVCLRASLAHWARWLRAVSVWCWWYGDGWRRRIAFHLLTHTRDAARNRHVALSLCLAQEWGWEIRVQQYKWIAISLKC
jgi:hypothetical protein